MFKNIYIFFFNNRMDMYYILMEIYLTEPLPSVQPVYLSKYVYKELLCNIRNYPFDRRNNNNTSLTDDRIRQYSEL